MSCPLALVISADGKAFAPSYQGIPVQTKKSMKYLQRFPFLPILLFDIRMLPRLSHREVILLAPEAVIVQEGPPELRGTIQILPPRSPLLRSISPDVPIYLLVPSPNVQGKNFLDFSDQVPNDIIVLIGSYLPLLAIWRLTQLSSRLRTIFSSPAFWRNKLNIEEKITLPHFPLLIALEHIRTPEDRQDIEQLLHSSFLFEEGNNLTKEDLHLIMRALIREDASLFEYEAILNDTIVVLLEEKLFHNIPAFEVLLLHLQNRSNSEEQNTVLLNLRTFLENNPPEEKLRSHLRLLGPLGGDIPMTDTEVFRTWSLLNPTREFSTDEGKTRALVDDTVGILERFLTSDRVIHDTILAMLRPLKGFPINVSFHQLLEMVDKQYPTDTRKSALIRIAKEINRFAWAREDEFNPDDFVTLVYEVKSPFPITKDDRIHPNDILDMRYVSVTMVASGGKTYYIMYGYTRDYTDISEAEKSIEVDVYRTLEKEGEAYPVSPKVGKAQLTLLRAKKVDAPKDYVALPIEDLFPEELYPALSRNYYVP